MYALIGYEFGSRAGCTYGFNAVAAQLAAKHLRLSFTLGQKSQEDSVQRKFQIALKSHAKSNCLEIEC